MIVTTLPLVEAVAFDQVPATNDVYELPVQVMTIDVIVVPDAGVKVIMLLL